VNAGPPPARNESSSRFRSSNRGGGGDFSDSKHKVHVGNLAWGVDHAALESLFREQGNVLEARVVYDRDSGRSRGFGFVTYSSPDEVSNAIESLDGVVSFLILKTGCVKYFLFAFSSIYHHLFRRRIKTRMCLFFSEFTFQSHMGLYKTVFI